MDLNYIQTNEVLNGENGSVGEVDSLNRPLKQLATLLETGKSNTYANKTSLNVISNTMFELSVENYDVVAINSSTEKYEPMTNSTFIQNMIGIANLDTSIIHTSGVVDFSTASFITGKVYYIDSVNPGKIVAQGDDNQGDIPIGVAISTTELMVKHPMQKLSDSTTFNSSDMLGRVSRKQSMSNSIINAVENTDSTYTMNSIFSDVTYDLDSKEEVLNKAVLLDANDTPKDGDTVKLLLEAVSSELSPYSKNTSVEFTSNNLEGYAVGESGWKLTKPGDSAILRIDESNFNINFNFLSSNVTLFAKILLQDGSEYGWLRLAREDINGYLGALTIQYDQRALTGDLNISLLRRENALTVVYNGVTLETENISVPNTPSNPIVGLNLHIETTSTNDSDEVLLLNYIETKNNSFFVEQYKYINDGIKDEWVEFNGMISSDSILNTDGTTYSESIKTNNIESTYMKSTNYTVPIAGETVLSSDSIILDVLDITESFSGDTLDTRVVTSPDFDIKSYNDASSTSTKRFSTLNPTLYLMDRKIASYAIYTQDGSIKTLTFNLKIIINGVESSKTASINLADIDSPVDSNRYYKYKFIHDNLSGDYDFRLNITRNNSITSNQYYLDVILDRSDIQLSNYKDDSQIQFEYTISKDASEGSIEYMYYLGDRISYMVKN